MGIQSGRMAYDFSSLSHTEFEDLARDLLSHEIGKHFEAFSEGPDDAMDGRHALADGNIVLQENTITDRVSRR